MADEGVIYVMGIVTALIGILSSKNSRADVGVSFWGPTSVVSTSDVG